MVFEPLLRASWSLFDGIWASSRGRSDPIVSRCVQAVALLRLDSTAWVLQLCMDSQIEQVLNPFFRKLQSHIWTDRHASVLFEMVNDADTAWLHQLH